MALLLHKIMVTGEVVHEAFSRETWEAALTDKSVARRWGHDPENCHDPTAEIISRHEANHKAAAAPRAEPVTWPPDIELTPWCLTQLATLCMDDARLLLAPKRIELKPSQGPRVNKKGQFLLF